MVTRNMERAKEIAASMHAEGREVKYVFQDATKPESDLSLVEEVVAQSGHIDVLFNNFGTSNSEQDGTLRIQQQMHFLKTVKRKDL